MKKQCENCGKVFDGESRSKYCSRTCTGLAHRKWDTERFVAEARKIHGDKYDYSKTVYTRADRQLTITCHVKSSDGVEHGDWQTYPSNHLRLKCGCNLCGYVRSGKVCTHSWESWLAKAKKKHGDKYSYSKAESQYVNGDSLLTIVCPVHGEFEQKAFKHIRHGCNQCGGRMRLTRQQFISKSMAKHGEKYDYSLVVYINNNTPVDIICPIHGLFSQIPANHMEGGGCRMCVGCEDYTLEMFVAASEAKHGKVYDYSKVKFNSLADAVDIVCPKHGVFSQNAARHKNGAGCSKCNGGAAYDHQMFLERSREVHGAKYDYSKSVYVLASVPVEIICPKHGSFWQKPINHWNSGGCRKCKESKNETKIRVYLENHKITHEQFVRVKTNEKGKKGQSIYLEYDFILGDTVIEFHGEQHYIPPHWLHPQGRPSKNTPEEALRNSIVRDCRKATLAREKGWKVLIVPFWDAGRLTCILDDFFAGRAPKFSQPPQRVQDFASLRKKLRAESNIDGPQLLCGCFDATEAA